MAWRERDQPGIAVDCFTLRSVEEWTGVDGGSVLVLGAPVFSATKWVHPLSSKSKSDPHQRTRRDHALETAEDYVEAVAEFIQSTGSCRVGDLAGFFGVSHVTVSRIVGRLVGEDLLKTEPYRPITLTAKGKRLAEKSAKRHQIVHDFLLALGVDEATASLDTEGIEHHVSPKTLKKLQALTQRLNDEK